MLEIPWAFPRNRFTRSALRGGAGRHTVCVREDAFRPNSLARETAQTPAKEIVYGEGVILGKGLVVAIAVGEGELEAEGEVELKVVHVVHVAYSVAHAVAN